MVLWVVAGDAHAGLVGGWALAVVLMVAATTLGWLRTRGRQPRTTASPRAIRRATIHAALLAMLWATVPLLWFGQLPIEDQLVIACLMTGMICAGGFALSTVAPAAHVYVGILTLGSVLGLLQTDNSFVGALVALIVAYSLIVVQSVSGYSRLFAERFVAEARLKDRGEIIELLLNDFEENASDWLFETDPDFAITSHSPRFAVAAGLAGQSLVGRRIADLLAPEGREELARRIAFAEPFRDVEVRVETPNGPRWWSLTARPSSPRTAGREPGVASAPMSRSSGLPATRSRGWRGPISSPACRTARISATLPLRSLTGPAPREAASPSASSTSTISRASTTRSATPSGMPCSPPSPTTCRNWPVLTWSSAASAATSSA